MCTSAQYQCHGCEPHKRAALAGEKKCDWLARQSDICGSAANVIVSADPHMRWREEKKILFFQPRYEMVTFAGVVWRQKREGERGCADTHQEGEDVSDILMYVWP